MFNLLLKVVSGELSLGSLLCLDLVDLLDVFSHFLLLVFHVGTPFLCCTLKGFLNLDLKLLSGGSVSRHLLVSDDSPSLLYLGRNLVGERLLSLLLCSDEFLGDLLKSNLRALGCLLSILLKLLLDV